MFMKLPAAHGKQVPLPVSGWTVPALHLVCSVPPVGAKWPISVGVHSVAFVSLVELECEPLGHGSGADAPTGQNEPGLQDPQAVWPASS